MEPEREGEPGQPDQEGSGDLPAAAVRNEQPSVETGQQREIRENMREPYARGVPSGGERVAFEAAHPFAHFTSTV
jgi:hypothetical protein